MAGRSSCLPPSADRDPSAHWRPAFSRKCYR